MPSNRTPKTYRLPSATIDQIAEIASRQHGLTDTRVVEFAVEELHRSLCRPKAARRRGDGPTTPA